MATSAQFWTDWGSVFTHKEDSADVCVHRKFYIFVGLWLLNSVIYSYKTTDS
jgi:hypothetical protein